MQIRKDVGAVYNIQLVAMSGDGSELSLAVGAEGEWSVSSGRKGSSYVPGERSGKWSGQEHMKYIAFIDFNKDRMRSRDKRRSNKFYQEMADFIVTRNALQCRSHHQKLEEKYTHAPKIVNLFKPAFDRTAYRDALEALQEAQRERGPERAVKQSITEIGSRSVETQTDIAGLNLEFINVSPNCYLVQSAAFRSPPPPQPSFYYNSFFLAPPLAPTAHSLPSADAILPPVSWDTCAFPHDFAGNSH